MSIYDNDENGAGALRKREVESYLRGEAPPPRELAKAPQLQDWRAVIAHARTDAGQPRLAMVLVGRVSGHPRLADGRFIHTSEVIWLDHDRKWAAVGIASTSSVRRPATEPPPLQKVRREIKPAVPRRPPDCGKDMPRARVEGMSVI